MCNPHECSNAVLGNDDWQEGPCGQNPRELLDENERLRALIAGVVRSAKRHTESQQYGKVYHYNARWNRDSKDWMNLLEVAEGK